MDISAITQGINEAIGMCFAVGTLWLLAQAGIFVVNLVLDLFDGAKSWYKSRRT